MILIQTRWHEDDLAGRILSGEDAGEWTVVSLPALAESADPLGRAEGEALCPERFDLAALQDIRTVLGSWSFAALYQQRPVPEEGGMFKRAWFGEPIDALPNGSRFVRYWDRAATSGGGDYTVGALLARLNDMFYVADVVRGRWGSGERDQITLKTTQADYERYGRVMSLCEQEPGSSGKDAIGAFVRLLVGFPAFGRTVTGDKAVRAEPFAAQAAAGNVHLKRGVWVPGYLDELCSFPQGSHDDQVDASSGAFNELAGGKSRKLVTW
jgi:predicted phage terminase large subunit-like protein